MLKKLMILFVLEIFILFVGWGITPAQSPIRIGGSEYPISTFTENGKIQGLDYEIIEAILREVGITSTLRLIAPWKRIVRMLNSGEVDMVVPMVFTEERKKKYNLAPSIRPRYNLLIVPNGFQKSIKTISDLKGLEVGKCDGYAYQKEFVEAAENKLFETSYCVDNTMGLAKLKRNRMDAFMIGEDAALYLIKKLGFEGKFKYTDYRAEKASHVGIHKSNTDLYRKFLIGFEKAKRKRIIERIIQDWKKLYSIN